MTSEQTIRRSDILNTQVITRDNGKRLGIVSQVWVDIDQREVVAFGLRDSLISISSLPRQMYLSSINQIGDVILVDNEDVIEEIDVEALSNLINWEVITETGEVLGRVRSFKFNGESGKISSIVIASLGLPQIPEQLLSTYEISIDEVVSTGPNRLIVFEGAEERVNQLSVGVLERLGIGKAPWERDSEEEYGYSAPRAVSPANQLPSGVPLEPPKPKIRTPQPIAREQEEWSPDYVEEEIRPQREVMQARAYESIQYEEEEDNWSETTDKNAYQTPASPKPTSQPYSKTYGQQYEDDEDLEGDAWLDVPKPVNIPKKVKEKQVEYEEES
ncbi:photosystem reaction center subunit H [Cylindrospermopsis raciborskii S07]|uniref:Photosystem reaction center subunit H n=3 Tax=Cylindrospermopsis raciborskii TaxID=77022 RepID=A0A853MC76_9CYAN|nr:PRC-barrel domain-containing protein [Cylindrospermopsis raciborskii]EFA71482.1 PRC-barrel protein [Cylindrospermopsis raciborskii CS-505]MBA4446744.1 PRC-barrel domain-containing protein [Cylindrospermopsis raciborskii CS-506_C]MBA4450976.1 PRC-barrel domain-containing protein [Cylindrospermopsis raciborskii CS-506_D]MBA4457585.1 PRC-barrel domain-containing protein [Cylindrospermopsis raciborskii CS-506_B]MBA4466951.1 PRC-barrel domain-containing protein [Cylindrospermopsis raciborskii CS